jgi:hypothetical protein
MVWRAHAPVQVRTGKFSLFALWLSRWLSVHRSCQHINLSLTGCAMQQQLPTNRLLTPPASRALLNLPQNFKLNSNLIIPVISSRFVVQILV